MGLDNNGRTSTDEKQIGHFLQMLLYFCHTCSHLIAMEVLGGA